jgi:3-oxoadipate enol-lactonase
MPKIQSNGINLYYEIHGEGQPLLLIHGLGSSARDWEYQVAEFSESYEVITFDLRGHGQSDKPAGPYSMELTAPTWSACHWEAASRFNWRWTRPRCSNHSPS